MKIGIIADDLTGANDTGVQFARRGLKTSVIMQYEKIEKPSLDVLVIDTDSRSSTPDEAYESVKKASKIIKSLSFDLIFKKLDSTMRGNVGVELDAVYDVFNPDFILIVPAYPQNRRRVKGGSLYLDQKLLHETDFANDPKTPINESYIPNILKKGTKRNIALITQEDLKKGNAHIKQRLVECQKNKVPYIVFDSCEESDLEQIAKLLDEPDFNIIWSGSAGIANYLAAQQVQTDSFNIEVSQIKSPVLMVVGSVNKSSRDQLDFVLSSSSLRGIELKSHLVVADDQALELEIKRVHEEVEKAIMQQFNIILYSSGSSEEILLANQAGEEFGLNPTMVSDRISQVLGEITARIIDKYNIQRLLLTGGDTAKKACASLRVTEFKLIGEIEIGIPIGILQHQWDILTITKAGGFGSLEVLLHAYKVLKGEKAGCDQSLV